MNKSDDSMVKILATEEEIHEAERRFYHPELWPTKYIGRWCWPTKVEFDCDEENMLREIARYTGYSRDFIAREAVRYMYDEWYLKQPRDSGPYFKVHEPVIWVGPDELNESEEVDI